MATNLTPDDTLNLLNQAIHGYFQPRIQAAGAMDAAYQALWETLYELIQSGGKRLRPQMTFLAYDAFGGTDGASIIPVALAQELLHFSLLIHDDIIDRDYTRYGTLNVAGTYKASYSDFLEDEIDRIHFAHSAALLGGDLMLSGAHELIAGSSLAPEQKTAAATLLSKAVFDVAGGELLDTELSFKPYTKGAALTIALHKTAGYSFTGPLITGASLAGASMEKIEILEKFSSALGVAYQLVDDLLGVFGEEATTGKSTISDITEGKRTFMVECASELMSDDEKLRFETLFGKQHATAEEIEEVKNLLVSSGARAANEQKINECVAEAKEALTALELEPTYHDAFEKLIQKVTKRAA